MPSRRALVWGVVAAVMWQVSFVAAQMPAPYAVLVVYLSPEQIEAVMLMVKQLLSGNRVGCTMDW